MVKIRTARNICLFMLLIALIPIAYSASVETATISVKSIHSGLSAGEFFTAHYDSRATTTHHAGSNYYVLTDNYQANNGWFLMLYSLHNTTLNSVQCSNDSISFRDCNEIRYNDNITLIRVNCTAEDDSIAKVNISLYNREDDTKYIDNLDYNYIDGDFFYFRTDYKIRDSGNWSLSVTCKGINTEKSSEGWSFPWGWINVTMINPFRNTTATLYNMFTAIARVECFVGECGSVNVTLDPKECWEEEICNDVETEVCKEYTVTECTEDCSECEDLDGENNSECECNEVCADIEKENCTTKITQNCSSKLVCEGEEEELNDAEENIEENETIDDYSQETNDTIEMDDNVSEEDISREDEEEINQSIEPEDQSNFTSNQTLPIEDNLTGNITTNQTKSINLNKTNETKSPSENQTEEIGYEDDDINKTIEEDDLDEIDINDTQAGINESEQKNITNDIPIEINETTINNTYYNYSEENDSLLAQKYFQYDIESEDKKAMIVLMENRSVFNYSLVVPGNLFTQGKNKFILVTPILAADVKNISYAKIILPKIRSEKVNVIRKCKEWDFNDDKCLSDWKRYDTDIYQNDSYVWFVTSNFSAYAGGNYTRNESSYLIVWDSNDLGMPNTTTTKIVDEQIMFYADFMTTLNSSKITDAECWIGFYNESLKEMEYSEDYGYYVYNKSFSIKGLYNYNVSCNHSFHNSTLAKDSVLVTDLLPKSGAVSTIVGDVPFYTTSANPQNCSWMYGGDSCIKTWQVNTTGLINSTHQFYVLANMTSNILRLANKISNIAYVLINLNDTINPKILTATIQPKLISVRRTVYLHSTASDNVQVQSCWANVTLPNSAVVTVENTCSNNATIYATQQGTYNVTFFVKDSSGNIGRLTGKYFKFVQDNNPPKINLKAPVNETYNKIVGERIVFEAYENTSSKTSCTIYSKRGENNVLREDVIARANRDYIYNFSFSDESNYSVENGSYSFFVECSDAKGNDNVSETVYIFADKQPPVTEFSAPLNYNEEYWYNSTVQITLSGSDDASGVSSYQYKLGKNGNWQIGQNPSVTRKIADNRIYYRSEDNVQRREIEKFKEIKVDTASPNIKSALASSDLCYPGSDLKMEVLIIEKGSGISNVNYFFNSINETLSYNKGKYIGTITCPNTTGAYNITIRATDNTGNSNFTLIYFNSTNSTPFIYPSTINRSFITNRTNLVFTIYGENTTTSYNYSGNKNKTHINTTGDLTIIASKNSSDVFIVEINSSDNVSDISKRYEYYFDNIPPKPVISGINPGSTHNGEIDLEIRINYTGFRIKQATLKLGSEIIQSFNTTALNYTINTLKYSDNQYILNLSVEDFGGNINSTSLTFRIRNDRYFLVEPDSIGTIHSNEFQGTSVEGYIAGITKVSTSNLNITASLDQPLWAEDITPNYIDSRDKQRKNIEIKAYFNLEGSTEDRARIYFRMPSDDVDLERSEISNRMKVFRINPDETYNILSVTPLITDTDPMQFYFDTVNFGTFVIYTSTVGVDPTNAGGMDKGGGGGGGGGAPSNSSSFGFTFDKLIKDKEVEIDVNNSNIMFSRLSFTPRTNLSFVTINIEKLDDKPDNAPKLDEVYQYIKLSAFNLLPSEIGDMRVELKVLKSWIDKKGIRLNEISLYYFDGVEWQEIDALHLYSSGNEEIFECRLSSMGYYALAANKRYFEKRDLNQTKIINETVDEKKENITEEIEETVVVVEPEVYEPTVFYWILFYIALFLVISYFIKAWIKSYLAERKLDPEWLKFSKTQMIDYDNLGDKKKKGIFRSIKNKFIIDSRDIKVIKNALFGWIPKKKVIRPKKAKGPRSFDSKVQETNELLRNLDKLSESNDLKKQMKHFDRIKDLSKKMSSENKEKISELSGSAIEEIKKISEDSKKEIISKDGGKKIKK